MIKGGLTGGIGSGKSTVACVLEQLGVPVYHADAEAKNILESEAVKPELIGKFGNEIITPEGKVDRKALSDRVFGNPEELAFLNGLIHPRVRSDFESWCRLNAGHPYIVQEAAILFESGFDVLFDKTILVTAPEETCIQRVMKRDSVPEALVRERMKNQWDTQRKIALADYILVNDEKEMLLPQLLALHTKLISMSEKE